MGNKTVQMDKKYSHIKTNIPTFHYISRKQNSIFKIQGDEVSKHLLSNFKILNDSAIGYLPDGTIIVAGGSKSFNRFSKKVFCINTNTKSINRLPSLNFPMKKGKLLYHNSILYYFSKNLSSKHQIYCKKNWITIESSNLALISPCIYSYNDIIFFACGIKPNKKPTKKIFYINPSEDFNFKKHETCMPIKLIKPIINTNNHCLILAGGKKISGEENFNFFFHWFGSDKWKEVEGPQYKIEKYPGIKVDDAMIWIGLPKIIVIFNNKFHIFNLINNEKRLENVEKFKSPKVNKILPKKDEYHLFFFRSEIKPPQNKKILLDLQTVLNQNSQIIFDKDKKQGEINNKAVKIEKENEEEKNKNDAECFITASSKSINTVILNNTVGTFTPHSANEMILDDIISNIEKS